MNYTKTSDDKLLSLLESAKEELKLLRKEYNDLGTKMQRKVFRIGQLSEEIDKRTLKADNIPALLETFPETKIKRQMLRDLLSKWGLKAGGYFSDTLQTCIKLMLYKNDDKSVIKAFKGLSILLPYIKPRSSGNKYVDIFEHTLSLYAIYSLQVTSGDVYHVYASNRSIFESKDLLKTLKYIQKEHYYE